MATSYELIYENVLPKFKDYDIPVMSVNEVKEMMHDYLRPAIVSFHVCNTDLSDRDDELDQFNQDLTDDEIEILSNYMLLSYLDSNYIRVPSILKATLSTKDFNAFSPANFLDKLLLMHKTYLAENETLLMRYAWKNQRKSMQETRKNKNAYKENCGYARTRKIQNPYGCYWS